MQPAQVSSASENADFAVAHRVLIAFIMSEDLEREPDGVPHDIVGRTAFASLLLAFFGVAMFAAAGWVGATFVAAIAIPTMVFALGRKSERERDHDHPSR